MEVFSLHGFCLIVCRKVSQCIWTCYTVCVYLVLLIHTELILAHTIYREAHCFWAFKQNQVLHFQQQHPLAWSHWGLCSCTVKWILCPSAKDLSCQEKQVPDLGRLANFLLFPRAVRSFSCSSLLYTAEKDDSTKNSLSPSLVIPRGNLIVDA